MFWGLFLFYFPQISFDGFMMTPFNRWFQKTKRVAVSMGLSWMVQQRVNPEIEQLLEALGKASSELPVTPSCENQQCIEKSFSRSLKSFQSLFTALPSTRLLGRFRGLLVVFGLTKLGFLGIMFYFLDFLSKFKKSKKFGFCPPESKESGSKR